MDELVFTPAAIIDLLSQIDELSELDIGIVENNVTLSLTVGDSTYEIKPKDETKIEVKPEVVEEISEASEYTYNELAESGDLEVSDPIESGLVKELFKTLLIGGMVRFAAKELKK